MQRVGIIGCGNIATVHAEAILRSKRAVICGFADPLTDRGEHFQQTYGNSESHVYESISKLIAHERPDAIHLCTPHALHVPMAISALQQGIHVMMEKPPAVSREQFEALIEAQNTSEAYLGICFQNRYNNTVRKVDELIREGSLGELLGGRAFVTWKRDASYYEQAPWKGTLREEGGSALINQGIHSLDLLLHWLGEPTQVETTMANHHLQGLTETEDTCEAYLTFAGGKRALLYISDAYVEDAPVLIELSFTNSIARIEEDCLTLIDRATGHKRDVTFAEESGSGKRYWGSSHNRCIDDFYRAIETKTPYQNDLSSVRDTFETMMKMYETAWPGK